MVKISTLSKRVLLTVSLLASVALGAMAQVSYSQTWATTGLNGWTSTSGTWARTTTSVCATTGSVRANLYNSNIAGIFLSPSLTGNTGVALLMSYQYKIINFTGGGATPNTFGSFKIQYAASTSGPWTDVSGSTISTNHVPSTSCVTKSVVFTPPAGALYVRFNATWAVGDYYLYFDEVSIGVAPSCLPPTTLSATPTSPTAANLSWVAPASTTPASYNWEVRTSGAGGSGATGLTTSGSTTAPTVTAATGNTLTANTNYSLYVRSDCGGSGTSTWAGPLTFTTPCASLSIPTANQPFAALTLPACWSTSLVSGTQNWAPDNTNDGVPSGHTDTYFMGKDYTASDALAVSQAVDMTTATAGGARINVWIYRNTVNKANDRIRFHVNTAPNLTGATQILEIFPLTTVAPTVASSGWYNYTANIPASYNSSTALYVIAQGTTDGTLASYGIGFDDFKVENQPSCGDPTTLLATPTSAIAANLSWVAPVVGTPASYNWEVRTSGAGGSGATGLTTSGSTTAPTVTAATGNTLSPNTAYSLYVRTDCGGSVTSTWAGPFTFTTPCTAVSTFPWTETFEAASPTLGCWKVIDGNADSDFWGISTTNPRSGTQCARLYTDFNTANQDYLITPQLDLGAAPKRLRFWVRAQTTGEPDEISVKVSNTTGVTIGVFTATILSSTAVNTTSYVQYTVDLSAYAGQQIYIAFVRENAPADGYYLHLDDVLVENKPALDMSAVSLVSPGGCPAPSSPVTIRIKNNGSAVINFAANNVGVNVNVTGVATASLSATVNTGSLAVGATLDVVVDPAFNMSLAGTYNFAASTALIGDGDILNDAMPATSVTQIATAALSQSTDFTGFTGTNLTTLFPNWREASGVTTPSGTVSAWRGGTLGGTSAAMNLFSTGYNEWIMGPKFVATSCTQFLFKAALTDYSSTAPDPDGMTTTDDKVQVMVSNNCGQTYTAVYTFDNTNQPTNTLTPFIIDLSSYAGQEIIVGIKASEGVINDDADYDFHVDDLTIENKPSADAGATALVNPVAVSGGICGTTATNVKVKIKNFGCGTLTSVPVTVNVTGAVTQTLSGTWTGSLAPGATVDYSVGNLNMTIGGAYTFNATTNLSGDGNASNNALPAAVVVTTINPNLTLTAAPTPLCANQVLNLTAVSSSGNSYSPIYAGSSGAVNLAIPDNDLTTGISSTIALSGPVGNLSATATVKVSFNIPITWSGDIDAYLVDPSGTRAMELTTANGGGGDNYTNTVLLTGAATSITAGTAPFTGTFAPEGDVNTGVTFNATTYSALVGSPLNGNWTLRVFDGGNGDLGTLNNWSLEITDVITGNYTYTFAGSGTISPIVYSGANNSTGAASVTGMSTGAQTYSVTVNVASGCSKTISQAVSVTPACYNTWQGDVAGDNTNWFNPGNWSSNVVPVCGDAVTIPTVPVGGPTYFPVVSGPTLAEVGNITVQNSAKVTLNGQNLQVCGSFTGGSSALAIIDGSGTLLFTGSTLQTITGKTAINTLQVNKPINQVEIVSGNVQINTALELKQGNLKVSNVTYLTFLSNSPTHCAVLDNYSSGFSGTFLNGATPSLCKAQRAYTAAPVVFNQHFMGSPMKDMPLSQFATLSGIPGYVINSTCDDDILDQGSPYGNVYRYDESHVPTTGHNCPIEAWEALGTGSVSENSRGYLVKKNTAGTITASGTPNIGSSYTISGLTNSGWSNSTAGGFTASSGWHLAGNAYLSKLDLGKGNSYAASSGVGAQVHIWNESQADYDAYMMNNPAAIPVAPFQGFYVRALSNGASFTLSGNDRSRTVAGATFWQQSNDHQLDITVSNPATGKTGKTVVAFNGSATNGFDGEMDANKLPAAMNRHTLYTVNNGEMMSINTLKSIEETSTVDMNMYVGATGNYTMNFAGISSFDPTSYIMLEDKKLNVWHNARNGDYTFSADSADNSARFVLHFTPKAEITANSSDCNNSGTISIVQPGTASWNYTIAGGTGTVATGTLNQNNPIAQSATPGVYTVTLVDNNNYTVVKQVQITGSTPVTANMTASANIAEVSEDISFANTTTNVTTTNWNFGDGSTATTATASHNYQNEGVYTVTLTTGNADGCAASVSQTVTVTAKTISGISSVTDKNKINIWSHENKVYVDLSSEKHVEATIEIYNIIGQQLSSEKFGSKSLYSKSISNLEAAYVIVRVLNEDRISTRKVFISNK